MSFALTSALANKVVSLAGAIAHIYIAIIILREGKCLAVSLKHFPVTVDDVLCVVGIPVHEKVLVVAVLPPRFLAHFVPEAVILKIRHTLVGVLSAVLRVNAIDPALKFLVAIRDARIVADSNGALLFFEHVEGRALSLKSPPALVELAFFFKTVNDIEVVFDLIEGGVIEFFVLADEFPGLIKFAGFPHIATIEFAALEVAVDVLVLETLNLRAVVGNEANVALLVVTLLLSTLTGSPEVVELLARVGLVKNLIALWLVDLVVKSEASIVLMPPCLVGKVNYELLTVRRSVGPLAINGIIKVTHSVIVVIGAAFLLERVVTLLWGHA